MEKKQTITKQEVDDATSKTQKQMDEVSRIFDATKSIREEFNKRNTAANKKETVVETTKPVTEVVKSSVVKDIKINSDKETVAIANKNDSGIITFNFNNEKAENNSKTKVNPTGFEDINLELGKFTKKAEIEKVDNSVAVVAEPVVESKKTINFEKFKHQKKIKIQKSSKYGDKVNLILRDKKKLTITWIIEIAIMLIIIGVTTTYIVLIAPNLNYVGNGPYNFEINAACANVGYIFSFIASCILAIPFIFLITSWFVGINGVYKSKGFHYTIWIILLISIVFFLIASGLCLFPLIDNAMFGSK